MTSTTPTFKHPLIPARTISAVRLPHKPPDSLWDITFSPPDPSSSSPTSTITSITPHNPPNTAINPPLALPPLTHPHIHLDKAFLHRHHHHHPSTTTPYHLPTTGTFPEALHLTSLAKSHFTPADLLTRGRWVLADSVRSGVTALRAFVEVDETVGRMCLDVAVQLKREWAGRCAVQIVCFAQEGVFSGPHGRARGDGDGEGEGNRGLIERVLADHATGPDGDGGIDVLGTTPYVESDSDEDDDDDSPPAYRKNIDWAITTALNHNLHLDFHLDYNLDPSRPASAWYVLRALVRAGWTRSMSSKKVMLGHCTRLTLFDDAQWRALARYIGANNLPVYFVGLPTSDLYMAAQPSSSQSQSQSQPHLQPRGTLPIPQLIRAYGLRATLGVNNVGNAFTPWGSLDPLALASLGVGVYQAGTVADAELLYECVSVRAREAMGLVAGEGVEVRVGEPGEVLLIGYGDGDGGVGAMEGLEGRGYRSVAEVVWEPPAVGIRRVVCAGLWEDVGSGKRGEGGRIGDKLSQCKQIDIN